MKYVEVILPLPLAQTYTYAIPEGMASQVLPNGRVIVPFGARASSRRFVCGQIRFYRAR